MTHQALTPFARKLAETMCRVEFKDEPWRPVWVDDSRTCGWTQKDHEAILDRPRVVEP